MERPLDIQRRLRDLAAAGRPDPTDLRGLHVAAMRDAYREPSHPVATRSRARRRASRHVRVLTLAGALLLATTGLAWAGALPEPIQDALSRVAGHAGITLPRGDDRHERVAPASTTDPDTTPHVSRAPRPAESATPGRARRVRPEPGPRRAIAATHASASGGAEPRRREHAPARSRDASSHAHAAAQAHASPHASVQHAATGHSAQPRPGAPTAPPATSVAPPSSLHGEHGHSRRFS